MRHFVMTNIEERGSKTVNYTRWRADIYERKGNEFLTIKRNFKYDYSSHEQSGKEFLCREVFSSRRYKNGLPLALFDKRADLTKL